MARTSFGATIGQSLGDGQYRTGAGASTTIQATETRIAAVTSAVATLVADGPTPTQAHVNTLDSAWTAALAVINAQADVEVSINTTNVTTRNGVKALLDAIRRTVEGSGLFS